MEQVAREPSAASANSSSTTGKRLDADDVTVAYVGGGSRQWVPDLVQDLALSAFDGTVRLYDVDIESAARNAEFGNWVQDRDATTADWEYTATDDLAAALDGADVVLLSTQYNPTETFVHDLDIPKEHGIYGAVAATIGPGGIFRAMRTIPLYREFAAAVRENCPDAWVFNFTNPVHFVTRALYDEFPDINAFGMCHEVLHGRDRLAKLATEHLGMDADRSDVSVNVKGINHFTWIDEAYCRGVDLWPLIDELAHGEEGNRTFSPAELEDESPFTDPWQVSWELYREFDLLPFAGDRHIVEYATWFLQGGKEELNRWGVKRTGSDFRAKHWTPSESEQTTDVEAWLSGETEFELEASGEVLLDVLEALSGGGKFVTNVNVPNRGQVEGIERGAVVETNALVGANEIRPLSAGGFPRPVRSLLRTHVDTIETVVEAARTGDLDHAFRGFLLDPQVRTLQTEEARELFAELAAAEEEYLDDWNLDEAEVLAKADAY
ncbi:family 4 glycosyl hydrolase [Halopelagius longus]|uniref:Alpha-galactosidase n=1 Tax=Halopelagius longus TaxID=1236180 RepID=A0A1H1G968_9EURY|nr:glycoside hydrolase family 4 [Halopelagius longus]RDI69766.1 glycoside hydrolase family 4 [Halopelagius longus]SDR09741.1 alpha-galactosidase [Halopelagius longus]